jgi:hypothetical protein
MMILGRSTQTLKLELILNTRICANASPKSSRSVNSLTSKSMERRMEEVLETKVGKIWLVMKMVLIMEGKRVEKYRRRITQIKNRCRKKKRSS